MTNTLWKELQLRVKLGYNERKLRDLQREASDSYISYDEILDLEMRRLREVRRRVR